MPTASQAVSRVPKVAGNSENGALGKVAVPKGKTGIPVTRTLKARSALGDISNRPKFRAASGKVGKEAADVQVTKKKKVDELRPRSSIPTLTSSAVSRPDEAQAKSNGRAIRLHRSVSVPEPAAKRESVGGVSGQHVSEELSEDLEEELQSGVQQLSIGSVATSEEELVILPPDDAKLVLDYIHDIMAHFREREVQVAPLANYMDFQKDLTPKMREILVDWLVQVHAKFRLRSETLFLTISVLDRFLQSMSIKKSVLQLVGCTAMFSAAKYEEVHAPELRDFIKVCDYTYEEPKFLRMEAIILNTLDFSFTVPSALRFAQRFVKLLPHTEQHKHLVQYLIEITLQNYHFVKYLPSITAASAVFLSRLMLSPRGTEWPPKMVTGTLFSKRKLAQCAQDLRNLAIENMCKCPGSCKCKLRAVRQKYAKDRHASVSNLDFRTIPEPSP